MGVDHNEGSVDAEVEFSLGEPGVFRRVFDLIVLLFIDYVDFRLVLDLLLLDSFFDPENVLVGTDGFLRWLTDRTHWCINCIDFKLMSSKLYLIFLFYFI